MAEHLASIFGTEKDRVNCPFYFKVREDQSAVREIFFFLVCWWCFPESNRIGSNWKSIHIEHSLTFLSLSLTLTLSHPSSLRSFPNDNKMCCCVLFPHDVRVGPKRHRSARADTASDALDCITNQPSRKRFCSSTCTRYAFATTTRSLRCALFSHLIIPSSLPFSSSF